MSVYVCFPVPIWVWLWNMRVGVAVECVWVWLCYACVCVLVCYSACVTSGFSDTTYYYDSIKWDLIASYMTHR